MSLQEAEEEPMSATTSTFCCPVCCEDVPQSELAIFVSCAHKTCRRCAITWIEKAEASGQQTLPGCPWCRASLTPEETETILGRPFQPREPLQAPSLEQLQLDDLTRQWLEESTQACAGCGSRVEKVQDGGCDLMECLCGYRWCWNCGTPNAQCCCTPAHHYFWDNLMDRTAPRAARPRAHRNTEGEIDWRQHVQQRLKQGRSLKVQQERKHRRIWNEHEIRTLDRPTSAAIWLFQANNSQSGLRMLSQIVQMASKRTDRYNRRNENDQELQLEDTRDHYGGRWLYNCKGAGSRWLDYITATDILTIQRTRQRKQVQCRREILEADASVLAAHWMFPARGCDEKMLAQQTRVKHSTKRTTTNPLREPRGVLVHILNGTWLFQRKSPSQTRLQVARLFLHLDREQRHTRFNQRTPLLQHLDDHYLERINAHNNYWLFGSDDEILYPTIQVGNRRVQVGRPVVMPTHLAVKGLWKKKVLKKLKAMPLVRKKSKAGAKDKGRKGKKLLGGLPTFRRRTQVCGKA